MKPLHFSDCVTGRLSEEYFYLDGLSECLGSQRYKKLSQTENTIQITPHSDRARIVHKIFFTALKVLTFCTLIIPFAMLCDKIIYRISNTFDSSIKPRSETTALKKNEQITVGTYNILFPQRLPLSKFSSKIGYSLDKFGRLYENSAFRTDVLSKNLLNANLDVICLQEVTEDIAQKLEKKLLGKYAILWTPHTQNSHGVAIAYKAHKFTQLSHQKLKATVKIQGKTQDRSHLIMDLQDSNTKKIFRIASCHLIDPRDLQGDHKTVHASKVLNDVIAETASYHIDRSIIAGDMNQDQYGDRGVSKPEIPDARHATAFKPFFKHGYKVDQNLDPSEYDKLEIGNSPIFCKDRRIDWLFCNYQPEHLPLENFDIRGSDHRLTGIVVN